MTRDCCVFKLLRRSVDEKHLMRFHSETSVFKFLQRSVYVDGTLVLRIWQLKTKIDDFLQSHYLPSDNVEIL